MRVADMTSWFIPSSILTRRYVRSIELFNFTVDGALVMIPSTLHDITINCCRIRVALILQGAQFGRLEKGTELKAAHGR